MFNIDANLKDDVVGRGLETKSILIAMEAGKHVLLEGPPGTSKSTLLRTIARASRIPLYRIEGNVDLTPAKLVGHFNPANVMSEGYQPEYFEKGPLTMAMEGGGILYIEEFNRMPADVSNVLISPMEEGEMTIPRYGLVKAVRPFTLIAAQNPYDDVGTVRVSRAFMDRICLIKMDYQSESEECEIVRIRTGLDDADTIAFAVGMVRETRNHPDIKLGASIRAAIDMVALFAGMQKLADDPEQNILMAAQMALPHKIRLNEMTQKSADEIVEDIWNKLKRRYGKFSANTAAVHPNPEIREAPDMKEGGIKNNDHSLADRLLDEVTGKKIMDFESNDPHNFWRMASYFNKHPEKLDLFFEQPGSLEAFARMLGRLENDVAAQAIKIASRIIIKIARQIADSGYRSGKLELVSGCIDGAEIELDRSIERHMDGPERGILKNLVSYVRHSERQAFVMMLDFSYSMQSKIILSAITAAAIAQHFKKDYAVLAFSNGISILREVDERAGPEKVLERLFALQSHGDTNIRLALEAGLKYITRFERKTGLLLTDGDWNRGGDPFQAAVRYHKLSIIGFPPAENEKIRRLAFQGKGSFSFVRDEREIAGAILRCLN